MPMDEIKQAREALEEARERYTQAVLALMKANEEQSVERRTDVYRINKDKSNQQTQDKHQLIADARLTILEAIERYMNDNGVGVRNAVESVAKGYPGKTLLGIPKQVYGVVSPMTETTLWNWRKAFGEHGREGLLPQHKGRTASYISAHPEIAAFIEKTLVENTDITGVKLHEKIAVEAGKHGIKPPSLKTCTRMILKWRSNGQL